MEALCGRLGYEGSYAYMKKNWHTCQDRWMLGRRSYPHNSRARPTTCSSHGWASSRVAFVQIKHGRDRAQSRRFNSQNGERAQRSQRPAWPQCNIIYDEEMSNILRFATQFIAGKIAAQYSAGGVNTPTCTYFKP